MKHCTNRKDVEKFAKEYAEVAVTNDFFVGDLESELSLAFRKGYERAEDDLFEKYGKDGEEPPHPTMKELRLDTPQSFSLDEVSCVSGLQMTTLVEIERGSVPETQNRELAVDILSLLYNVTKDTIEKALEASRGN